jgi:hypothetical protein
MRRFLGTLVIIAAVLAVIGNQRGWFTMSQSKEDTKTNVNLTFDRDKIEADTRKAAKRAAAFGEQLEQKIRDRINSGDNTKAPNGAK